METVLPRRCETCLFHRPGPTPCTGRCGHPDRQPPHGHVVPHVRTRELNCYAGMDTLDLWRSDGYPPPSANGGDPWGRPGGGNGSGPGPRTDDGRRETGFGRFADGYAPDWPPGLRTTPGSRPLRPFPGDDDSN